MCSVKQVRHIFRTNDRIYADACILMNAATLEAFFGRYGDIMKKEYSKIIIPASVRKEIARLLCSNELDKRSKAIDSISVINKYSDLIIMEGGSLSEEGLGRVHADPEIIATLTLGRKTVRQLLITNDRDLAADVYGLNELRSCKGKPITVCYIDYEGRLKISDCVTESIENGSEQPEASEILPEETLVTSESETPKESETSSDEADETVSERAVQEEDTGDEISGIAIVTGIMAAGVAGYKLYKHGHDIASFLKLIMKKAS